MARSESEHIDNIKGRKEITVKKKLIDKINFKYSKILERYRSITFN